MLPRQREHARKTEIFLLTCSCYLGKRTGACPFSPLSRTTGCSHSPTEGGLGVFEPPGLPESDECSWLRPCSSLHRLDVPGARWSTCPVLRPKAERPFLGSWFYVSIRRMEYP